MAPSTEKSKSVHKHSRTKSKHQEKANSKKNSVPAVKNDPNPSADLSIQLDPSLSFFQIPSSSLLNLSLVTYAERCEKSTRPLFGKLVSKNQFASSIVVLILATISAIVYQFVVPNLRLPQAFSLQRRVKSKSLSRFIKLFARFPNFSYLPQVPLFLFSILTFKNGHQLGHIALRYLDSFPSPYHASAFVYGGLYYPFAFFVIIKLIDATKGSNGGFIIALTAILLKSFKHIGLDKAPSPELCLVGSFLFDLLSLLLAAYNQTQPKPASLTDKRTLVPFFKGFSSRVKSSFTTVLIFWLIVYKILPTTPRSYVHLPFISDTVNPKTGINPDRQMLSKLSPKVLVQNTTSSVAGQVIVAEMDLDEQSGYMLPMRFLRVDHSLLGGVWMPKYPKLDGFVSIYPAFYVQEAAQFIKGPGSSGPEDLDEPSTDDEPESIEKSAILLGLGIGTATHGLVNNGYNVTVLDIDPVIYESAVRFFGLDPNITSIITDARDWIDEYKDSDSASSKRYDLVIHDFFSGANGHPELMSRKTFATIKEKVLVPESGVLVVNLYGSLDQSILLETLLTLQLVFGNMCDIFHDKVKISQESPEAAISIEDDEDVNLVAICRQKYADDDFDETKEGGVLKFDMELIKKSANRDMRGVVLSTLDQRRIPKMRTDDLVARLYNIHALEKEDNDCELKFWKVMTGILPSHAWLLY